MTVWGTAIGISVFVSLMSISGSVRSQIKDLIETYNIDISVQEKGATTPITSRISISDYYRLSKTQGIGNISSMIIGSEKASWNEYFVVVGVSSTEHILSKFVLNEGRLFSKGKKEIIIGELLAGKLNYRINDTILIAENENFVIAGIYRTGSRLFDGAAVFDTKDAQRILKRDNYVNMAFIQVENKTNPTDLLNEINQTFKGFSAKLGGDFVGQVRLFKAVRAFALAISIISFITCCFVVMNTLLMAISERIKEIGILMAIGWSRMRILNTILFEAVIICFFGGVLGNFVGLLILWYLNHINAVGLGWIPVSLSPKIFFESIGLSILLGILSGLYPAIVASKLMPVEALRHE